MALRSNYGRTVLPGGVAGGPFDRPGRAPVECVEETCANAALSDAPVGLCSRHLRQVYEYAQVLVAQRLDEILVEATEADAASTSIQELVLPDRGDLPGWVYFVRFGDRIKIGYSTKPHRRLRNLPVDAVLGAIPGSLESERALHVKFGGSRIVGEWFHDAPDLLVHIRQLTTGCADV